jgi:hypothetical protein
MKVLIVGATGSIGKIILQACLVHPQITQIITLTRRPLTSSSPKHSNITIPDFGALNTIPESTWTQLINADALIWAMGTYDLNKDVNFNYPLAFQKSLAQRVQVQRSNRDDEKGKFRFILLGGAFTEANQSRRLFFLWEQRRLKGLLRTRTLEFARERSEWWAAAVVKPGGVLLGGDTWRNWVVHGLFGDGIAIRAEVLGACVAELVVSERKGVVENVEMVGMGRNALGLGVYRVCAQRGLCEY